MKKALLIVVVLLVSSACAEETTKVVNPTGFASIGWVFAESKKDLYEIWAEQNDNTKLKGSVATFLDWPNVSRIIVIYNGWHLRANQKDMRIQHIEDNLNKAAFGDRFKGNNPGGEYVLLLQYKNSEKEVLLCFKEGLFLVESRDGIGVVDIRKTY